MSAWLRLLLYVAALLLAVEFDRAFVTVRCAYVLPAFTPPQTSDPYQARKQSPGYRDI